MGAPLLSLCMIVKNEAENLPRCLASASDVVDEIVVVDTGSSDTTPVLAARAGAKVFHVSWENDFAKARNAAIDRATGAWVLVLDADEELAESFRKGVRRALERTPAAALRVVVENLSPAGDVAVSTEAPSVRVFRNAPAHRYERSIHEQVTPSILRAGGMIQDVEHRILHHGYTSDRAQGGSRAERNLAMLEAELARTPEDAGLRVHVGLAAKAKGDFALARSQLEVALGGRGLPDEARARATTALAQLALARNDLEGAVRHGTEALDVDAGNVAAAHVVAVAQSLRGELRAALPLLEKLVASPRTSPSVRRDLGVLVAYARHAR